MEANKKQKHEAKSKPQSTDPSQPTIPSAKKLKPRGGGISRRGLSATGMRLAGRAKTHEDALATVDWPPAKTLALSAKVEAFDAADTAAKEEKEASKDATATYDAAVSHAVDVRSYVAANIRLGALGDPEILQRTPLKLDSARRGDGLMQWFIDVPALIQKVSGELGRVSSVDWIALVEQARKDLADAQAAHQGQVTARAELAEKRLIARNALVDDINALVVNAGVAFAGNKSVLQQFKKGYGKHKAKPATATKSTTSVEGASPAAGIPEGGSAAASPANAQPDGQAAAHPAPA